MFGPSLMVAPLFTGQQKRSVYLPKGDWFDFWTGRKYAGGRRIEVDNPLDEIPVFVKGGSLLPLAEPVEYVTPPTELAVTVRVYGPKPRPFVLYEDDGVTFDFERGVQNRVVLTWDGSSGSVTKTGGYHGPSRYKIVGWTQPGN